MFRKTTLLGLAVLGFLVPLAFASKTSAQPVISARDPDTGGRYVDGGLEFGVEAEKKRLDIEKESLIKEADRLTKNWKWLKERLDQIREEAKNGSDEWNSLSRKVTDFRCPNGYTLQECFARPPVCVDAILFKREVINEGEQLKAKARRLAAEAQTITDAFLANNAQVAVYKQRLSLWQEDLQALNKKTVTKGGGTANPGVRKEGKAGTLQYDEATPKPGVPSGETGARATKSPDSIQDILDGLKKPKAAETPSKGGNNFPGPNPGAGPNNYVEYTKIWVNSAGMKKTEGPFTEGPFSRTQAQSRVDSYLAREGREGDWHWYYLARIP